MRPFEHLQGVRKDMKDWMLSDEGDKWSVRFDVWGLGEHLGTTFRGWSRPKLPGSFGHFSSGSYSPLVLLRLGFGGILSAWAP